MCILVYKEPGVDVLEKAVYNRCFTCNPDGAGFAWWDAEEQTWHVRKGFMTFKSFWKVYKSMAQVLKATNVFTHFRVGTSGNRKGPDCTHPFPIEFEFEPMRLTEFSSPNIAFHNGVIGAGSGQNSDTMVGVQEYIAPLWSFIDEPGVEGILEELLMVTKCRWALTKGPDIYQYGTWVNDDEFKGHEFSNKSYEEEQVMLHSLMVPDTRYNTVGVSKFYRNGSVDRFEIEGGWSWSLWKNKDNPPIKVEDKKKEEDAGDLISPHYLIDYINKPATVIGLLTKFGDIDFESGYCSLDDLISCPSCGADRVVKGDDNGEIGHCKDCGCIFNAGNGEIVMYDPALIGDSEGKTLCLTCGVMMESDEWGCCVKCDSLLDHVKMEAKHRETQEQEERREA